MTAPQTQGLTFTDTRNFRDMLMRANNIQLRFLENEVASEIKNRKKNALKLEKETKGAI